MNARSEMQFGSLTHVVGEGRCAVASPDNSFAQSFLKALLPLSLFPFLACRKNQAARRPAAFPGAILDRQHSSRRHGRLPPDLPKGVCQRGLASLDIRDGTALKGRTLPDIQRCSARWGIASPNLPQSFPRSPIEPPNPRQGIPRSPIAFRNLRQGFPRSPNAFRDVREGIPRSGIRPLWLFDHLSFFTTPVR